MSWFTCSKNHWPTERKNRAWRVTRVEKIGEGMPSGALYMHGILLVSSIPGRILYENPVGRSPLPTWLASFFFDTALLSYFNKFIHLKFIHLKFTHLKFIHLKIRDPKFISQKFIYSIQIWIWIQIFFIYSISIHLKFIDPKFISQKFTYPIQI